MMSNDFWEGFAIGVLIATCFVYIYRVGSKKTDENETKPK